MIVRRGNRRIEGYRLLEMWLGFTVLLLLCEQRAKRVIKRGILGRSYEGFFDASLCGCELRGGCKCAGVGDCLLSTKRLMRFVYVLEQWDGLCVLVKLYIGKSEVELGVGIVRVKLVGQLQFGDRCLWVVLGK